jgi:hypothetical protein
MAIVGDCGVCQGLFELVEGSVNVVLFVYGRALALVRRLLVLVVVVVVVLGVAYLAKISAIE